VLFFATSSEPISAAVRRQMRCIRGALGLLFAAAAAGCGGDDKDAGVSPHDASVGESDGDFVSCPPPGDPVDDYHVDLTKPGTNGALTFTLVDSDNAPPQRGISTWRLQLTRADESAVTGPVVGRVRIPHSHGHPPPIQPETTFDATQGLYVATPVYFFLAGYWAADFAVFETNTDAEAPLDSASFYFCIE
jgi:hypothetical protein